jgi:hypothetical protein
MPAVIVRQRLGSRSGKLSYQAHRWYARNRAHLAVTAAFVVACGLGMAAVAIGAPLLDLAPVERLAALGHR